MNIHYYSNCPFEQIAAKVDQSHRRLSSGNYYLQLLFARTFPRVGMTALVYVKELSTGVIYPMGISNRIDDSRTYERIRATPEGSVVWAQIILTRNGYPRFAKLELLASNQPVSAALLGKLGWDLASRGRTEEQFLRIPFLWQRGIENRARIVVIWLNPELQLCATDFDNPSAELPIILRDIFKRRELRTRLGRRKDSTQAFEKYLQGSTPDDYDFATGFVPQQPSIGLETEGMAPYNIFHLYLSPIAASGGIKRRRKEESAIDLTQDSEIFRLIFRVLRPNMAVAVGAEVARRVPKILREISFSGPYQLPALGQIPCGRMNESDFARQEFEGKWTTEFIAVPDLKYFGKRKIGGRILPDNYWAKFELHLKCAIGRNLPMPATPAYSKSAPANNTTVREGSFS